MDKQKLIDAAREMVGVPFRHEGRSPSGVDCYGLLIVLGQRFGIDVPIEIGYGRRPSGRHMRMRLEEYSTPVHRDDISPGDILHIKYDQEPQHLAIVSNREPLRIIHADSIIGRVVEQGVDASMRNKIRGVYRVTV